MTTKTAVSGTKPRRSFQLAWRLPTRAWRVAVPGLGMLALTLWPIVFLGQLPDAYDFILWAYPAAFFTHLSWSRGAIPFWNPYHAAGAPYLADPGTGATYPLNVLFFGLLTPSAGLRLILTLQALIGYFGAYWFARTLGASRTGSVFAALSYAFGGFALGQIAWPHIQAVTALWPVLLGLIEQAYRSPGRRHAARWAVAAGVVFALQWLPAFPQGSLYASVGAIIYALVRAPLWSALRRATEVRRAALDSAFVIGVWLLVGIGLFAFQLLPTLQFLSLSNRATGYDTALQEGGVTPRDLSWLLFRMPVEGLFSLYLGAPVLLLALYAVIARWRRGETWLLAGLFVGAVALAVHWPAPIWSVISRVPGVVTLTSHAPERGLFVGFLAACILAGFGVQEL